MLPRIFTRSDASPSVAERQRQSVTALRGGSICFIHAILGVPAVLFFLCLVSKRRSGVCRYRSRWKANRITEPFLRCNASTKPKRRFSGFGSDKNTYVREGKTRDIGSQAYDVYAGCGAQAPIDMDWVALPRHVINLRRYRIRSANNRIIQATGRLVELCFNVVYK